ncbi:MAG: PAS domain S-box protein, partial [Nitrospirae bacterium]
IIPFQHREQHQQGLQRFLSTGEGPVLSKRIELMALRRDGTEFPVELSIRPLKIGDTRTFHAFIADVTDRKRGDEALREADRIEALGKLAGEIAQDFDRLITAITRQSTFLMGCLDQDDRLRDGIEEIKNAAGQAAVLTKICWPSAAARCSIRRCWTSMPS